VSHTTPPTPRRLPSPRVTFRPFDGWLLVIAALALAGRVLYTIHYYRHASPGGDSFSYHYGARLLADGEGYIDPIRFLLYDIRTPSAYHPPLYLTYLAAWTKVGLDTAFQHRLVSCLAGAFTVWLIGRVGLRLGRLAFADETRKGEVVGLLAAGLAAVYPHLWLNDAALLSETTAATAVALCVLALLRYVDASTAARAFGFGAAAGLAALGRAEMLLYAPLVAVPIVIGLHQPSRATIARHIGLVAAGGAVLTGPWMVYNLARFNEPTTISTGLGATLLGGACDGAFEGPKLGYWDSGPGCGAPQRDPGVAGLEPGTEQFLATAQRNLAGEGDESERDREARELATDYIGERRGRWLTVVIPARIGRLWGVYRPWQTAGFDHVPEGRRLGPARAALLAYYVLMATGIAGLVVLHRARVRIWPFLALAAVVTISSALTFGIQRYRIPVDTVLPALAAVGVVATVGLVRSSKRRLP
jgi:hypothetical protein